MPLDDNLKNNCINWSLVNAKVSLSCKVRFTCAVYGIMYTKSYALYNINVDLPYLELTCKGCWIANGSFAML